MLQKKGLFTNQLNFQEVVIQEKLLAEDELTRLVDGDFFSLILHCQNCHVIRVEFLDFDLALLSAFLERNVGGQHHLVNLLFLQNPNQVAVLPLFLVVHIKGPEVEEVAQHCLELLLVQIPLFKLQQQLEYPRGRDQSEFVLVPNLRLLGDGSELLCNLLEKRMNALQLLLLLHTSLEDFQSKRGEVEVFFCSIDLQKEGSFGPPESHRLRADLLVVELLAELVESFEGIVEQNQVLAVDVFVGLFNGDVDVVGAVEGFEDHAQIEVVLDGVILEIEVLGEFAVVGLLVVFVLVDEIKESLGVREDALCIVQTGLFRQTKQEKVEEDYLH